MPRFAANISFLFTELPFLDRFAAAAAAGFDAVEFHYPYDHDSQDVRDRLAQYRLKPVLINIRSGSPKLGEWGFAGVPGREESFRLCVAEAIEYALAIGVSQLNCLAGVQAPDTDTRLCEMTLISNLRYAARESALANLAINLEPINTHDVPGYLVSNSTDAIGVMDVVGARNLMLQFDCYHMQIMEGGGTAVLAATIERLLPRIGHIQFADAPGRHEPGSGEIDFADLFARIDRLGAEGKYAGWVSAEYRPSEGKHSEETFGWLHEYEDNAG
ncbi:MAG: TIM barrel protein [Burkholderiales bacterium]|nr:TIM barrel protein [Burkholderiales bacterium]